jgi:RNA methyltransferase, TrmH family
MDISSLQNPRVKQWTGLLEKKGRDKEGQFLIEGIHLVEEALHSDIQPYTVVYSMERASMALERLLELAEKQGIECVAVSEAVLAKCTDTQTPQPVFAVMPKLPWKPESLMKAGSAGEAALVLVVDGVQDPGNLGTIIRSADAVGATGILLGKGTVDLYNPKTVRSTMGSLFHLPIAQGDLLELLPQASAQGSRVVTTSLQGAVSCYDYDFTRPTWIVIGNEGQGVSEAVRELTEDHVLIPMKGNAESLNAAMAATVILFEAVRQRG